jgi:hypothetical protein
MATVKRRPSLMDDFGNWAAAREHAASGVSVLADCTICVAKSGMPFATFPCRNFSVRPSGLATPPSDHTPLSGVPSAFNWNTLSPFHIESSRSRPPPAERPAGVAVERPPRRPHPRSLVNRSIKLLKVHRLIALLDIADIVQALDRMKRCRNLRLVE